MLLLPRHRWQSYARLFFSDSPRRRFARQLFHCRRDSSELNRKLIRNDGPPQRYVLCS